LKISAGNSWAKAVLLSVLSFLQRFCAKKEKLVQQKRISLQSSLAIKNCVSFDAVCK
jgi:hypothetical protein